MQTLQDLLAEQADSPLTPRVLRAFDYLVPGTWDATVDLETIVRRETPLTDAGQVRAMADYAALRYVHEDGERYRDATAIYSGVDSIDKVAAGAAFAAKAGELFDLGVLKSITPKADTTQAIDAGIKLVAEIAAFTRLEGAPRMSLDSLGQFASKLATHASDDRMRLAAWVLFDGLLPLGPDFVDIIGRKVAEAGSSVSGSPLFGQIARFLPEGAGPEFVRRAVDSTKGWANGLVAEHGLSQASVIGRLDGVLSFADDKLDYVAAALDMTTNYFEYTGAQTVARHLVIDWYPKWQKRMGQAVGAKAEKKRVADIKSQKANAAEAERKRVAVAKAKKQKKGK